MRVYDAIRLLEMAGFVNIEPRGQGKHCRLNADNLLYPQIVALAKGIGKEWPQYEALLRARPRPRKSRKAQRSQ
jgi:hypothetical protein